MYEDLRETPVSEESIFHGKIIDVARMQVKLPNGRIATREVVRHKGAAAVVPVDANGMVTLVRQHRVVNDLVMLEIPAGKLDSVGEDPFDAANRELEEETGMRAEHMDFLMNAITTPGFCTESIGIYLATGLSQHEAHLDPGEFLHVEKMPLKDAVDMVMRGEFRDMKTALGLLMAWQRLHG